MRVRAKEPSYRTPHRSRTSLAHHEGVAEHGLVHLGGELPGDDAGPHGGGDQREGGPPPRSEGERHHGPADPGGDGDGVYRKIKIPEEVIERVEAGLEGEYAPEYLVEPEHIREGLAEA